MHASHADVSVPVVHAETGTGAMMTAARAQYRERVRLHDVRLSTHRPATQDADSQLALPVPQSQHVDVQSAGDEQTPPAGLVPRSKGDDAGHMPCDWSDASSLDAVTAPLGALPANAPPLSDRFHSSPGWRSHAAADARLTAKQAVTTTARS